MIEFITRILFAPIRLIFWTLCSVSEWLAFRAMMRGSLRSVVMELIFMIACVGCDECLQKVAELCGRDDHDEIENEPL